MPELLGLGAIAVLRRYQRPLLFFEGFGAADRLSDCVGARGVGANQSPGRAHDPCQKRQHD